MSNTEINALMAEYASDGCDLSNDKTALLVARRLVSTMPDSQARCALHSLTLRIATLEHKLSEAKEREARLRVPIFKRAPNTMAQSLHRLRSNARSTLPYFRSRTMDEPTKEAIEEASALAEKYRIEDRDWDEANDTGLARLLADVRKKARDDALEEAALVAMARVNPILSGSAFAEIADAIRALKDQPSGEQP